MCELQMSNIKEAVHRIFEAEGFKASETPQLSEQLRQLLLENPDLSDDDVDKILGCTSININGGQRQTRRARNRRSARCRRAAPSSRRGHGRQSRHNAASTRRQLK